MAAAARKNTEISQPLLGALASGYGSAGASQAQGRSPVQVDPAVLARTMQILAEQMAANQSQQQAAPSIARATAQQTLNHADGQYIGDLQDGVPHGRGTLTYHPGNVRKKYEGEWVNGLFHGRGVLRFSNEDRHEGQWENGRLHGQCILFAANGDKYEGSCVDGQPHGHGTQRNAKGHIYVGGFENGQPHGQGCYTWSNGGSYTGAFRNGQRHGHGTKRFANGDTYVGDWENDRAHGQGTLKRESIGESYTGGFVNDDAHGSGTKHTRTGTEEGIFMEGRLWNGKKRISPFREEYIYQDGIKQEKSCCRSCLIICGRTFGSSY